MFAVCDVLASELGRRFDYLLNETHESFDSLFLTATALDPNLRLFINGEQKNLVRRHIKKAMRDMVTTLL